MWSIMDSVDGLFILKFGNGQCLLSVMAAISRLLLKTLFGSLFSSLHFLMAFSKGNLVVGLGFMWLSVFIFEIL